MPLFCASTMSAFSCAICASNCICAICACCWACCCISGVSPLVGSGMPVTCRMRCRMTAFFGRFGCISNTTSSSAVTTCGLILASSPIIEVSDSKALSARLCCHGVSPMTYCALRLPMSFITVPSAAFWLILMYSGRPPSLARGNSIGSRRYCSARLRVISPSSCRASMMLSKGSAVMRLPCSCRIARALPLTALPLSWPRSSVLTGPSVRIPRANWSAIRMSAWASAVPSWICTLPPESAPLANCRCALGSAMRSSSSLASMTELSSAPTSVQTCRVLRRNCALLRCLLMLSCALRCWRIIP